MAYFHLDLKPDLRGVVSRPHALNDRYKGARRFEMKAPDSPGVLIVYARDEQEAREHLVNALFDLIFRPGPGSSLAANPKCPFCKGRTQSHGRNSAGKRNWKCMSAECGRYFVLDRVWRGGLSHPAQSKKPAFVKLLLSGVPLREAADKLKLNISTAGNWAEKVAANNPQAFESLQCPCGRPMRHRGSCSYRLGRHLAAQRLARGA